MGKKVTIFLLTGILIVAMHAVVFAEDITHQVSGNEIVHGNAEVSENAAFKAEIPSTYHVLLPTSIRLIPSSTAIAENGVKYVKCSCPYKIKVKGTLDPAFKVVVQPSTDPTKRTISGSGAHSGDEVVVDYQQGKTEFVSDYFDGSETEEGRTIVKSEYEDNPAVSGNMVAKIERVKSGFEYQGTFMFDIQYAPLNP